MNKLCEANELAFFRADVCLGSPESFSLEEKARIRDDMEQTNAAIEDAIREDFATLPPQFQARMLELLCAHYPDMAEWWQELLIGKMPDSPADLMAQATSGNLE